MFRLRALPLFPLAVSAIALIARQPRGPARRRLPMPSRPSKHTLRAHLRNKARRGCP